MKKRLSDFNSRIELVCIEALDWKNVDLGDYGGGYDPDFKIKGINPEITPPGIDLEEVRRILEANASTTRRYNVKLCEDKFKIEARPTVYLCRDFGGVFGDSEFYLKHVPLMVGKGKLLEVGPGTGIISVASAVHNRYTDKSNPYVAVDINPAAVECARENARNNGLEGVIDVREGDVFGALDIIEKFDVIFWNHPFHLGNANESFTQMHGFDPLFSGIRKYAKDGNRYLNPGGRLLLGTGNYAELHTIRNVLKDVGKKLNLLIWGHVPFIANQGSLNTYNLYSIEGK
jgi:SAM-dependent methyltransferase